MYAWIPVRWDHIGRAPRVGGWVTGFVEDLLRARVALVAIVGHDEDKMASSTPGSRHDRAPCAPRLSQDALMVNATAVSADGTDVYAFASGRVADVARPSLSRSAAVCAVARR
jgi:hypothetical protein